MSTSRKKSGKRSAKKVVPPRKVTHPKKKGTDKSEFSISIKFVKTMNGEPKFSLARIMYRVMGWQFVPALPSILDGIDSHWERMIASTPAPKSSFLCTSKPGEILATIWDSVYTPERGGKMGAAVLKLRRHWYLLAPNGHPLADGCVIAVICCDDHDRVIASDVEFCEESTRSAASVVEARLKKGQAAAVLKRALVRYEAIMRRSAARKVEGN